MKAKEFPEVNLKIPKPAFWNKQEDSLTFCFELNEDEINKIKMTKEIWIKQFTFGRTMDQIQLSCNKKHLIHDVGI